MVFTSAVKSSVRGLSAMPFLLLHVGAERIGGIPAPGFDTEGGAVGIREHGRTSLRRGYIDRKELSLSTERAGLKTIFHRKDG